MFAFFWYGGGQRFTPLLDFVQGTKKERPHSSPRFLSVCKLDLAANIYIYVYIVSGMLLLFFFFYFLYNRIKNPCFFFMFFRCLDARSGRDSLPTAGGSEEEQQAMLLMPMRFSVKMRELLVWATNTVLPAMARGKGNAADDAEKEKAGAEGEGTPSKN